ncbi:thioesterase family protein [Herbaspirillum sp. RTI4]|uniref:acyl-CoA thioesterase n=1 Tax=Herbaspirillum sp. RTI4 TaxID=3048640 RepID=UPI002AB4C74E|nr:thioesterase family protein [Herbaspirillum sp. RTI4]MDY7578532.1 thioesterase family protein [Herbaspirillum sp. RTI4]MEA9981439.1 thioesterase family protein [Herbaspirillum sp. RTI4]
MHTLRMDLRWGDQDAFGHVNNTVYFRYMEQARIDWLATMGNTLEAVAEGPVLLDAHCRFMRQLKYPGSIDIQVYVETPGRTSLQTAYEIRRVDQPEVLVAEGSAKIVWINFQTGKPIPLPHFLRQQLPQP